MKAVRFFIVIIVICFLSASLSFAQSEEKDRETMTINSIVAPFGSMDYIIQTSATEVAKKHEPWLRIRIVEGRGADYCLFTVDENPYMWPDTVFHHSPTSMSLAAMGKEPYKQQYTGYRSLMTVVIGGGYYVTLDPKIKTLKDMEGKNVVLGYRTQTWYGTFPADILESEGINAKVSYAGPSAIADALLSGTADVGVCITYVDPISNKIIVSPQQEKLIGSGKKVYYIGIGDTQEENDEILGGLGYPLKGLKVPNGTIPKQTDDLYVWTDQTMRMCKDRFEEKYAYAYVKFWLDHYKTIGEYHAIGKMFSPEYFAFGHKKEATKRGELSLHPGAVKAYEEAGVKLE